MSKVGLLDLLGVAITRDAAALWPLDYLPLDPALVVPMIGELAGALGFGTTSAPARVATRSG